MKNKRKVGYIVQKTRIKIDVSGIFRRGTKKRQVKKKKIG